jgi:hypothetical protein
MTMMKRSPYRKPIPLFDPLDLASGGDDVRRRIAEFAQAVGRRHRRSGAGVAEFLAALRGYHRTLAICSDASVPRLDDALVAYATRAYTAVRSPGRHAAA